MKSTFPFMLSSCLFTGDSPCYQCSYHPGHLRFTRPKLENILNWKKKFTTMNNKLELAVAQIFIVHATSTPVYTKHTRTTPSSLSLALSPVPSRHFVEFLSFTTKTAKRIVGTLHKTFVVSNACTGFQPYID